jgi:hypothetical protein
MRIFNTSTARKRWTGWMIASVVVLGLGESRLIGLVAFDGFTTSFHASFQNNRAEQKTPRDLNNTSQAPTVRETACGTPKSLDPWKRTFHSLLVVGPWNESLRLPVQSYESPRAPPREGFSFLC